MKRKHLDGVLRLLAGTSLIMTCGQAVAQPQPARTGAGKPPYNIIFVISDQRTDRLFAGADYKLPAIDTIARHGVTFTTITSHPPCARRPVRRFSPANHLRSPVCSIKCSTTSCRA